jgi:lipooligosaccharide transport system permease protein
MEFFSFYFTLFLTPLFLFSDIFFPLAERFSGRWLLLAEVLPLLHPVRLSRFAFFGARGGYPSVTLVLWDCAYVLVLSTGLLLYARRWIRRRLTA